MTVNERSQTFSSGEPAEGSEVAKPVPLPVLCAYTLSIFSSLQTSIEAKASWSRIRAILTTEASKFNLSAIFAKMLTANPALIPPVLEDSYRFSAQGGQHGRNR
jgi:hypothetical protein